MKKFDISRFERDFYYMLYHQQALDVPNLDRKFLYRSTVIRVKMEKSRIKMVYDVGNDKLLWGKYENKKFI